MALPADTHFCSHAKRVVSALENIKAQTTRCSGRLAGDISAASVTFCIGGPFGHHADVRTRADVVLSLSKCVLNHQVARIMLLEQLYRAWTITRGEPYHH